MNATCFTPPRQTYFIIVKGGIEDIVPALLMYNMNVLEYKEEGMLLYATVEADLLSLMDWIALHRDPPFPPGSLLYYCHSDRE